MGKMLLLIGVTLAGIGLLMTFSGVFNFHQDFNDTYITPLTDNTTPYMSSEGEVPNYNQFDHLFMHNLPWLFYIGAAVCFIFGLGNMRGGDGS
jgi:hypothetical protein